jgi:predicted S18 family serine protease
MSEETTISSEVLSSLPEEETTTSTTTTTESVSVAQLHDELSELNQNVSLIAALLVAGLVALVCRYCYRFLNIFF